MSCFLKHKKDIFFLFHVQNIKSNCYIIFLNFFPTMFFWWKIYSFQFIFIYKWFNLCYSFSIFPISLWFEATVTAYWKDLSFLLIEFICAFLFFIQSGESIYDPLRFWFILWHLQYYLRVPSTDSKLFGYLFLSESKSYLVTSFASSLIMISTFSFFECITPSASLSIKEIKITAIVSWIFHVPDFLRLFVMPFKHGIISWSNDLMVRRRIPNPEVPCSKLLVGSMVDSALHPYKVPKVSTRNFWKLSGKKQTASLKWI